MLNITSERLVSIEFAISRITNKINTRGPAFLVIFIVSYLLMTWYRAERKLLWYDEILTLYISRLPDFSSVVDALKNGVEFNLPFFYAWVRFSEIFFGNDLLSIRMPSIIGFGLLSLCLYRFVSIRTTVMGGVVASLFPLVTGALYYSYEARPYGIVLGLAGLALICWQSAVDPLAKRRFWWLVGLTLSLMCATLTHGYGLIIFAPLVFGEIVRSYTLKKVNTAVWVAFAIASVTMLEPFWMMRIVKLLMPPTFFPPRFMMVPESYLAHLGLGTFVILLAFVLFLSKALYAGPLRAGQLSLSGLHKHELAACLGFIAVPFLIYLLSVVTGTQLIARYSLTCVLGFSALIGVFVSGNTVLSFIFTVLLTTLIAGDFLIFQSKDTVHQPGSWLEMDTNKLKYVEHFKIMEDAPDKLSPIVLFGSWDFASQFYYAPPALHQRLTVLYWDKQDVNIRAYLGLQDCCQATGQFAEAQDFVKTHKSFLAYVDQFDGIKALQRFSKLGAEITLQQANPRTALFAVKFP